ncbi:hypothetical protein DNTS_032403, partial [Danionella cerebrum]
GRLGELSAVELELEPGRRCSLDLDSRRILSFVGRCSRQWRSGAGPRASVLEIWLEHAEQKMASTLREFTRLLDPRSLPRVLEVSLGIYCNDCGGVQCSYSSFGQECTLSTGDLLKIIQISIRRFTAVSSANTQIQLPVEYPGLFRLVPNPQPYSSVQEIVDTLRIEPHRLAQPVFLNNLELRLTQGGVLHQGDIFRITTLRPGHAGAMVECELIQLGLMPRHHSKEKPELLKFNFSLSVSQRGCFVECQDQQIYTLREIADWKINKGRSRSVTEVKKGSDKELLSRLLEDVYGELTLTPVYQMKAVSKLREDVLLISSDMDIEVLDVTDRVVLDFFIHPLSLSDIFLQPEGFFPVVAQLCHQPRSSRSRLPAELQCLFRSKHVIIHGAFHSRRILASETIKESIKRRFLIPESYKGRFKRRPRQFVTACDLERARSQTEDVYVVASRDCDSGYDGFASVRAGDEFIVTKDTSSPFSGSRKEKPSDGFECLRVLGNSEAKESVRLPVGLEGGFIELVKDERQFSLAEICRWFPLPFNVTVSMRDLSLGPDILAGVSGLQIEEEIWDPSLLVSDADISQIMEVSVNCTDLIMNINQRWEGERPALNVKSIVEQITEDSYFRLRRRYTIGSITPPPRPPKKNKDPPPRPPKTQSSRSESVNSEGSVCSPQTLSVEPFKHSAFMPSSASKNGLDKKMPSSPATLPRPKLQTDGAQRRSLDDLSKEKNEDDDDGHDYEYIDEGQLSNIRRTCHEQQIIVKATPSNTI